MCSQPQMVPRGNWYGEIACEEQRPGDLPAFTQPSEHPFRASFGNILRICLDYGPPQRTVRGQPLLEYVNNGLQGDDSARQITPL